MTEGEAINLIDYLAHKSRQVDQDNIKQAFYGQHGLHGEDNRNSGVI